MIITLVIAIFAFSLMAEFQFCRGKREILCGNCNGAGFMGGFMSTFDE